MFKEGKLLENDANWSVVKDEIDNWPMMRWVSILDMDTTIAEAKKAYNQMNVGQSRSPRSPTRTTTPAIGSWSRWAGSRATSARLRSSRSGSGSAGGEEYPTDDH